MKQYTLYNILLSVLLLAACSDKDEPSLVVGGEEAFATISVGVDGVAETKATTLPDENTENAINNLTVVFIDEDKNEVIGHAYRVIDDDKNTVRVGLKTGEYKMLVIANAGKIGSFDPNRYYDQITALSEQGGTNGFVMSNIPTNITILKGENGIKATVKRVVGRVELSNLAVDWKDNDLQKISGLKFHLKKVFLANVRPESYLFDMTNNLGSHSMEKKEGFLCGIDIYKQGGEIANESMYAEYLKTDHDVTVEYGKDRKDLTRFYVMTNTDTKNEGSFPVILYIKGDLYDDTTGQFVLKDRHYRIKLANGVQRNTIYKIEATIEGKGSPEPGDNKDNIDMSGTIKVTTWNDVTLETITINEKIEI